MMQLATKQLEESELQMLTVVNFAGKLRKTTRNSKQQVTVGETRACSLINLQVYQMGIWKAKILLFKNALR